MITLKGDFPSYCQNCKDFQPDCERQTFYSFDTMVFEHKVEVRCIDYNKCEMLYRNLKDRMDSDEDID